MNKLLMASLLALGVTVAGQQKASAWSEFKFSAGVNLGWVGGGNRVLWGLYRSAPYPGGPDLTPAFVISPYNPARYGGYPCYGAAQGGEGYGAVAAQQAPAMQPVPAAAAPQAYNPYYNTGYQPVGYTYPYVGYQAPSYWYGR